jgi:hypothetical protein
MGSGHTEKVGAFFGGESVRGGGVPCLNHGRLFFEIMHFVTYMLISSATMFMIQVGMSSRIGFVPTSHSFPSIANA